MDKFAIEVDDEVFVFRIVGLKHVEKLAGEFEKIFWLLSNVRIPLFVNNNDVFGADSEGIW